MNKYSRHTASSNTLRVLTNNREGNFIMKKDKKDIKKVVLAYSGGLVKKGKSKKVIVDE